MRDAVIIGAGPAGLSASVQLARASIPTTLVERSHIGGLAVNAELIENLVGFPDGINGRELAELMRRQIEKWGIEFINAEAVGIERSDNRFSIKLLDGRLLESKFLIVATGTLAERPNIDGLDKLFEEQKALYELRETPDEWNEIIVIGGGDVAFDYAIGLAKRKKNVKIILRGSPRALGLLVERAVQRGVEVSPERRVRKVYSDGRKVFVLTDSEEFSADGLMIATGRKPNDTLLLPFAPLSVDEWNCHSSVDGLYICGSVRHPSWRRHILIAASDGLTAATDIIRKSNSYGNPCRVR